MEAADLDDLIARRWLVYRIDTHGSKVLIKSGIVSHTEAVALVTQFERREHHQKYDSIPYRIGELNATLVRNSILQ